jgi:hypothetical protein
MASLTDDPLSSNFTHWQIWLKYIIYQALQFIDYLFLDLFEKIVPLEKYPPKSLQGLILYLRYDQFPLCQIWCKIVHWERWHLNFTSFHWSRTWFTGIHFPDAWRDIPFQAVGVRKENLEMSQICQIWLGGGEGCCFSFRFRWGGWIQMGWLGRLDLNYMNLGNV